MRTNSATRRGAILVACVCLAWFAPAASATTVVDGISDQSMAQWDNAALSTYSAGSCSVSKTFANSPFKVYFQNDWIGPAQHLGWARYFVPWDVMTTNTGSQAAFSAWYCDARSLGLKLDVSLYSTPSSDLPSSTAAYTTAVKALLAAYPGISALEAWNEPNNNSALSASSAAQYWIAANGLCGQACVAIAGDFLDANANMASYEQSYVTALGGATPPAWGLHPYGAVKYGTTTSITTFRQYLPKGGAGSQMWFTEAGAYYCEAGQVAGLDTQAAAATNYANLVQEYQPTHAFYYEFLYKDDQPPPCDTNDYDTALYTYSQGADVARQSPDDGTAALTIWGPQGAPSVQTGSVTNVQAHQATVTGTIDSNGPRTALFYMRYGSSPSSLTIASPSTSSAGLYTGPATFTLTGLQPQTVYYYQLVGSGQGHTVYGSVGVLDTSADLMDFEPNTNGSWINLRNFGNQTFAWSSIAVGGLSTPSQVLWYDVNHDGRPDLLEFEPSNHQWIWLVNNGGGSFGFGGVAVGGLATPTQAFLMDVNHDGLPDIVEFDPSQQGWIWLKNNGNGNFGWGGLLIAGLATPAAQQAFVMDVNGDGLPDIVEFDPSQTGWIWLKNNGNETFSFGGWLVTGLTTPKLVLNLGNIDGDGRQDIAEFEETSPGVGRWIWLDNQGTSFSYGGVLVSGLTTPVQALAMDINDDRMPDIVEFDPSQNGWIWLRNVSPGTYAFGGDLVTDLSTPALATSPPPGA